MSMLEDRQLHQRVRICSSYGVGLGGSYSETRQKGVMGEAFKDMLLMNGGMFIQYGILQWFQEHVKTKEDPKWSTSNKTRRQKDVILQHYEEAMDQGVADLDKQNKRTLANDDRDEDPLLILDQEETVFEVADTEMPLNQGDDMGDTDEQPDSEADPNRIANSNNPPLTFNDLMRTPIDFSAFAMNRLKINKLTKANLVGSVYNLLKGTCKSCVELKYNMEECYRALSDQLD
ncbi:hypothetical protein Tco_1412519 [Tanacetum coccineum]